MIYSTSCTKWSLRWPVFLFFLSWVWSHAIKYYHIVASHLKLKSYVTHSHDVSYCGYVWYNILWRPAITRLRELFDLVSPVRDELIIWYIIYHILRPQKKSYIILWRAAITREMTQRVVWSRLLCVGRTRSPPFFLFTSLPRKLKADLFSPITSKSPCVCWQSYSRYQVLSRLDLLQNTHLYPKTGCDCMEEGNVATRSNAPWSTPTSTNTRPYALSYGTLGTAGVALIPPSNPYLAQLWPLIQVSLQCSGPCGGL